MIRVRVPKGLEVLLLIISGSEAEKGMLILTFLISIEKEFGRLSVNIPEDARNKIEAIHELRRLIDRYSGMGTGDDAAQLYREFMANKNLFLSFFGRAFRKRRTARVRYSRARRGRRRNARRFYKKPSKGRI